MKTLTKGQYYGVKDSEKSFDGILLSQYDYVKDKTDWHYHENPYFMYVLRGNMKDSNTKTTTLCPPGSLMYNNWQEVHYGSKHSSHAGGFHLEFEKNWLEKNSIPLPLLEGSKLIENPQTHVLFAKLYHEFMLRDTYSQVTVELLLLQICDVISDIRSQNHKDIPRWVEQLKELVHFDDSDLNLQYLSQQLNVHPAHISRAVPQYLSVSLGEYIRQQKLKKAIPLLLGTDHSLTKVAYQTGFSDQSHFNRVFKSAFNMNPSAFRKKLHKNHQC